MGKDVTRKVTRSRLIEYMGTQNSVAMYIELNHRRCSSLTILQSYYIYFIVYMFDVSQADLKVYIKNDIFNK